MKRCISLFLLVAALGSGCAMTGSQLQTDEHGRLRASAPIATPGQTITTDPTISPGLKAGVNTIVYDSGGAICWIKYAVADTAWRPVPLSNSVTSDPSQSPGLKAPIGFIVYLNDGTAVWSKTGAGDTAWTSGLGGGGGGSGVLADNSTIVGTGVLGNELAGNPATLSGTPHPGTESVADLKRVRYGFDVDGWKTRETNLAIATYGVSQCIELPVNRGNANAATTLPNTFTNNPGITGGAAREWGTVGSQSFSDTPTFSLPKTTAWAVGYRAKFVSGSSYGVVGYSNAGNSHDIGIGVASSTTYRLLLNGAADKDSGVTIDSSVHDFLVGGDHITVTGFIDDVSRVTELASALTDEATVAYGYSNTEGVTVLVRMIICW